MLYNLNKLRWACRRGMLELDVLLGSFLQKEFENLDPVSQANFVKLLNYSDADLYAWLMGNDLPTDFAVAEIIRMIRAHVRSGI